MAGFNNLSFGAVTPIKAVSAYEGERVKLDNDRNISDALRAGALSIVRGESLRALAMVEYSRRVCRRLGVEHVDTLGAARASDVKEAKLATDADKIPGTAWCFGDYLDVGCRITGLFLALTDGALDIHRPDADGAYLFSSADLLRRDFTDSAKCDAYKSSRGRPKASESEKAEKAASREAEKAAKAALDAAAGEALRAKAESAATHEKLAADAMRLLAAVAAAAGYTGDPAGLPAFVAELAARPVRVEPVRVATVGKRARPAAPSANTEIAVATV